MNDGWTCNRATAEEALIYLPGPTLFASIGGSHLFGFPSPNSDIDIRGCHLNGFVATISLEKGEATWRDERWIGPTKVETVTHDLEKFLAMALKRTGYVLETLASPYVLVNSPIADELRAILSANVSAHHSDHYLGFAQTAREKVSVGTPTIKGVLYAFRALMTGIHLMRTGEVECNILRLNEDLSVPFIPELVAMKGEWHDLQAAPYEWEYYAREFETLEAILDYERIVTHLPTHTNTKKALSDLLVRARREAWSQEMVPLSLAS